MQNRDTEAYMEDIRNSIQKISEYTEGLSYNEFEIDTKTTDAVIRNLEIIGEAVNNLPDEFREEHKNVPWHKIISMRNKMIHEYFGVDMEIVWKTIKEDLNEFEKKLNL